METPISGQGKTRHDFLGLVIVGANVLLLLLASGLRAWQFRLDDPYTNPISDIATIFWILALSVGVVGLIVVGRRIVTKRRVHALVLIWFILVGIYIGWFLINFCQFMLTGL